MFLCYRLLHCYHKNRVGMTLSQARPVEATYSGTWFLICLVLISFGWNIFEFDATMTNLNVL